MNEPTTQKTAPRARRFAWRWVSAVMLVLIVAVGWAEWRGWPWVRDPLAQRLSTQLHRPVHLDGAFALHLLGSVRLNAGRLEVGQPDWQASGPDAVPMLMASDVKLMLPYGGLLKLLRERRPDALYIGDIELASLDARLSRDKSGLANWSLSPADQAPAQVDPRAPTKLPHIERLMVRQGQLSVEDAVLGLSMKVHLSTAEGEAGGEGLRVNGQGHYNGHPFEVHVSASGALPLLTQPLQAPPVPISIRAEAGKSLMLFDGVTRDLLKLGKLEGHLQLRGPSLAAIGDAVGVTLPTTAPFALDGTLNKDDDLWGLKMQSLKVGDSRLKGDFSLDRSRTPPFLSGELSGSQLALIDLAPAIGAATNGAPNPKPPNGKVLPQREFDVPSLKAMDAHVNLRIQRATLGALFAQPFEPLNADLQLSSGVLKIDKLLARTAGGTLAGSVHLDGNGPQLQWDTRLTWADIRLESWLKAPDTRMRQATQTSYISGQLGGTANLHGEGNSTAGLLSTLDGNAAMWVRDGQISRLLVEAVSLHVAEALGLLVTGDKQQAVLCAAAQWHASQGVLKPEAAIVDTPSATILASGNISLAKEQLDLTLSSHPKSFSPFSLRTPVDVTGSFADPSVSLHSNPLGIKVLASAALSTVAPLAAIIPLIDPGQATTGGCEQALQAIRQYASRP